MTQAFHLLLGFAENLTVFWDFKIRNSVRITEGSDNGDSDDRGSTVLYNVANYKFVATFCLFHVEIVANNSEILG